MGQTVRERQESSYFSNVSLALCARKKKRGKTNEEHIENSSFFSFKKKITIRTKKRKRERKRKRKKRKRRERKRKIKEGKAGGTSGKGRRRGRKEQKKEGKETKKDLVLHQRPHHGKKIQKEKYVRLSIQESVGKREGEGGEEGEREGK